jgi:translation initiation factor 6
MHVLKTSFHGNPNVGLYGYCTKKYLLIGPEVPRQLHADFAKVFNREVKEITIAGSSLIGVFLAGNDHVVLIPSIAYPEEIEKIKKLGIPYSVLSTRLTCFGNNTLINNSFALISPEYSASEVKQIKDALNVPILQRKIADVDTVGSVAIMNNFGCLVHYEAPQHDLDFIREKFQVEVEHGSVNLGNPYVKSGIIVNEHGFIMGGLSGGPEVIHADRTFGFID